MIYEKYNNKYNCFDNDDDSDKINNCNGLSSNVELILLFVGAFPSFSGMMMGLWWYLQGWKWETKEVSRGLDHNSNQTIDDEGYT